MKTRMKKVSAKKSVKTILVTTTRMMRSKAYTV